ncbi:MAG: RloB domain-containing protein [Desulfobacteraceae bacterium]|nr:MAG: RloB domain-containing protein [Desulfobacteraceae bacterium]
MNPRKRNLRESSLRRSQSPGHSGKTILVVTEGEKTEPIYLISLRNQLKLHAADIQIINAPGTDALTIVNEAISRRDKRKREAKNDCTVPYDSAWAVFDTERADSNPKLHDALQLARSREIKVALSNPCFEFWILLHDTLTTAQFANCAEVIRRIKTGFNPGYEKSNPTASEYLSKIQTAVPNSEFCRRHHVASGGDGNPSTDVDLLVRELNEVTRPHFRLNLDAVPERS